MAATTQPELSAPERHEHPGRLTRYCKCGCGWPVHPGDDWAFGHAQWAAMALISLEYGNIAGFLLKHGFGATEDEGYSLVITLEEEEARRKEKARPRAIHRQPKKVKKSRRSA